VFVQVYHLGYHKWVVNEGVVAYAGLLYWLSPPVLMVPNIRTISPPPTNPPAWLVQ